MRHLLWLLALCPAAALAADVTLTFTAPTHNTDGSAIPASGEGALTAHRIEYGTCSGSAFGTRIGEVTVAPNVTTAKVTNLNAGTYCFRAYSRNSYGSESGASNVATKTLTAPTPSPPTLLTVDTSAFQVKPDTNRFVFAKVGTVPLKTACSATQRVNTYHVVDRAKVKWAGSVRPAVVVARCG